MLCNSCQLDKNSDEFNAYYKKTTGFRKCKPCDNAYHAEWRRKRRENPPAQPESKTCKGCEVSKPSTDYTPFPYNKDGLWAFCRECDLNKKTEEERKAAYQEQKDFFRRYHRRYYIQNRDKILGKTGEYARENPHIYKKVYARRRAAKNGLPHEDFDVLDLLAAYEYRCALCGLYLGERYHLDHAIPISKGGGSTRANMQPTHPSCNQSKGARVHVGPPEWSVYLEYL